MARQIVTSRLRGRLEPEALENLRLLVSELVTNSIRHGKLREGDFVALKVSVKDRSARVEVTDSGKPFEPRVTSPTLDRDSRWGLYLVSTISNRWGLRRSPFWWIRQGKTVWCELELGPKWPSFT